MDIKKIILIFTIIGALLLVGFIVYKKTTSTKSEEIVTTTPKTEMKETPTSTILVAFGDSLTAGYGVSLEESYPSILQKKLEDVGKAVTIINMGVSGETTTGALERLEFVAKQNPRIVLLGLGANDMLRSSSPDEAYANLEKMIVFFKERGILVILLGMKSFSSNGVLYGGKFDSIYPKLAKEYSLPLVPFFLDGVALEPSLNTGDGIHPNKDGYEKIVTQNILPILLPYLNGN